MQANAFAKVLFILGAGADINSKVWGGASHPHMQGQPGERGGRWRSCAWRGGGTWSPDDPWIERGRVPRTRLLPGYNLTTGDHLGKDGITALMRACACKYAVDVYEPALLGAKEEKSDDSDTVRDGTMIKLLLQLGRSQCWSGAR